MQRSSAGLDSLTFITPYGYRSGSCGYCKDPESSGSYYANSSRMTVDDYQALVDRGWRRSGKLLYKPDQKRSCCPHYTIRMPASRFHPSRDQRQALHRWNRHVLGEAYTKEAAKLYPKSKEQKKVEKNNFDLLTTIHESEYQAVKTPPEPAHRFEITLETDEITDEKYRLFENYQANVHKEAPSEISKPSFKRFLCSSPLTRCTRKISGKEVELGSFHQCYRLDGRLIAMAVLDVLPHAVSAVYFIYHQDFEQWSFGKLSALREAALAVELGVQYYYMGYYIHSCVKMRYKADYRPQLVLDPETNTWDELTQELRAKLDRRKYVSLSNDHKKQLAQASMPAPDTATGVNGAHQTTYAQADVEMGNDTTAVAEPGQSQGQDQDENEEEEEDPVSFPQPRDAEASGLSIMDLQVPGVTPLPELEAALALGETRLWFKRHSSRFVIAGNLVAWDDGAFNDPASVKGIVAELAAAVGVDVARGMVLEFA